MAAPGEPPSGDRVPGSKPTAGNGVPAVPPDDQPPAAVEQTLADVDQTLSDADQTSSDSDQTSADSDQLAADRDQVASDHDLASGLDPRVHELSREIRERTARQRELSASARIAEADQRDASARARDLAAAQRDRTAEARDAALRELEAAPEDLGGPRIAMDVLLRAAEQRKRAREHRAVAAEHREQAARDRFAAEEDRHQAARERARSLADRRALMRELALASTDAVTGARMRAAGLADLETEIDRTRRTDVGLVVAYVDVVGLKARNDEHGHAAGDMLLKRVVGAIKRHVRPYDLVVRLGGDEFLCAMPGANLAEIHERFRRVAEALRAVEDPSEITAGFAELESGDTLEELIARADADLIEHRRASATGAGGDLQRSSESADAQLAAARRAESAG